VSILESILALTEAEDDNIGMISDKKVLAVVTARAGSVGLPGKNYKKMLGTPLFLWSVLSAARSKYVDTIIVSSNCKHVKRFTIQFIDAIEGFEDERKYEGIYKDTKDANRYNNLIKCEKVKFLQRPEEYATAISKNEEALIHAYNYAKENLGIDADIIANLQPTSPIRDIKDNILLDECLEKMDKKKADSLFTVSEHTPFFVHKEENGYVMNERTLLKNRPMRQELKEGELFFHDCGSVYLTHTNTLLSTNNRIGSNFTVFVLNQKRSLQVDTGLDFRIIEETLKEFVENVN